MDGEKEHINSVLNNKCNTLTQISDETCLVMKDDVTNTDG